MRIKQVLLLLLSIVLIISFNNMAYAERKILKPPALLSFNPEEHLDEKYKNEIKELKDLLRKYGDEESVGLVSSLYTTRKKSAKEIMKELFRKSHKDEINLKLKKIEQMIEDGSFNKYRTGVDFKIDEKNREYIVSWEDNGKEIIKRTPFVPEMKLIIKGDYKRVKKDSKEIMTYQYWIENKKESKASFLTLYLENKFPQDYILNSIKSKYGRMTIIYKIKDNLILDVSYPEGYLNYFRFFIADTSTEMLVKYHPGEQMQYPYELEEFEGSLPGVVECEVPISDSEFNPTSVISPHKSPEMAVDIVRGLNLGPHRYRYWGNTIAPVPTPELFDKTKFIDKIISYNNQSIEEGWNDKPSVIAFTKEGLDKIKKNPDDKEQIKQFLTKLEEYYKKDMILSEGYVLLRYNLEYLMLKI